MTDEPISTIAQDGSGGDNIRILPPTHLLMADETGQTWVLSVRPDGQLQTAKWPDGEPSRIYKWTMLDSDPYVGNNAQGLDIEEHGVSAVLACDNQV